MAEWAEIRRVVTGWGFDTTEVVLPGDDGVPAEGALQVSEADGVWTLSTVDYGQTRVLVRARDENDIAEALLHYVSRPLPDAERLDPHERERLLSESAPHLLDLAHRAAGGILIDLPPSLIVNRIGALDGIHLYPAETSFEARSLPPTALSSSVREFVTAAPVRVIASITPPWFGRPGGGIRFTVEDPSRGIRDLVVSGALIPVHPLA